MISIRTAAFLLKVADIDEIGLTALSLRDLVGLIEEETTITVAREDALKVEGWAAACRELAINNKELADLLWAKRPRAAVNTMAPSRAAYDAVEAVREAFAGKNEILDKVLGEHPGNLRNKVAAVIGNTIDDAPMSYVDEAADAVLHVVHEHLRRVTPEAAKAGWEAWLKMETPMDDDIADVFTAMLSAMLHHSFGE